MGGAAAPVEIKLFGKDLPALKSQADQIVQLISGVEGLRDVTHTLAAGKPEVQIQHRPRAGLPAGPVRLPGGQHRPDGHPRQGGHALPRGQRRDRRPAPVQGGDTATASTRSAASRSGRPRARRSTSSRWPTSTTGEGPIKIDRENQARARLRHGQHRPAATSAASSGRSRAGWPASRRTLPPGYFLEYGGVLRADAGGLPHPGRRLRPGHPAHLHGHGLPVRALRPPVHHHVHRPAGDHRRHLRAARHGPDRQPGRRWSGSSCWPASPSTTASS